MTKEEKQLLLKDLCARLPYGVICHIENDSDYEGILQPYDGKVSFGFLDKFRGHQFNLKPYLRPMSSMTEEEKNEMHELLSPLGSAEYENLGISVPLNHCGNFIPYEYMSRVICYLDSHYFDCRRLIEKGLALEAPEGMYKEGEK